MPIVTFIGGFKDGEKSDMPKLEVEVEFRELPNPEIITKFDFNKAVSIDDVFHVKSDWYRLEHLVSYEKKFFFYVQMSIPPHEWVSRLVDGYNPL